VYLTQSQNLSATIAGPESKYPQQSDTVVHGETLSYDARDKVLHAWRRTEDDYEGYSALGTLAESLRCRNRVIVTEWSSNFVHLGRWWLIARRSA
jgi:hypothetical protein